MAMRMKALKRCEFLQNNKYFSNEIHLPSNAAWSIQIWYTLTIYSNYARDTAAVSAGV